MTAVGVIGLGKLGACLAAVLAEHHNVIGYDIDERTVEQVNAGRAPVDEPGLDYLIDSHAQRTLRATTHIEEFARNTDIAFVIVPTPSDAQGRFDNRFVIDAVTNLGRALRAPGPYTVVIVSTVMPGSCGKPIKDALEQASQWPVGVGLSLVYSPAFIALGSVIHDLTHPDVILIGCDDAHGADAALKTLHPVAPSAVVNVMSLLDAEMAKLSLNVALSVKIAYANEVATICERIGANADHVLAAVGTDTRIGSKYLHPGGPASGPCLPRDLVAFDQLANDVGQPAHLASAADHVHRHQSSRVLGQLVDLSGVDHPVIGILGAAYKPGTHITDESIGVRVAARAIAARWPVVMHDPKANVDELDVKQAGSGQQVCDEADVILVATAWPEYKTLDFRGKPVVDLWGIAPRCAGVHRFGRAS